MSTIVAGTETQVNIFSTSLQEAHQVTALEGGGWVTTWLSSAQDGSENGVYQRIFAADGAPVSGESRVNTSIAENQYDQQVTALGGGGWVTTWTSENQDGSGDGVFQRVYADDGTPIGTETRVNTTTVNDQSNQHVTALEGGGWVVAWSVNKAVVFENVYQQIYASDGTPQGGQTMVGTFRTSRPDNLTITSLDGGGWVITAVDYVHFGTDHDVYQQIYFANGTPNGAEIVVNSQGDDSQYNQVVTALDGGGWVVTWQSAAQDGDGYGIYQQAFAADGARHGGEIRVNTHTDDTQTEPRIAALDGGGWVISWQSAAQDGSGEGVYQQVFAADGTPQGSEMRVNTTTAGDQTAQQITALKGGGWVVTWQSAGQDGSANGIYQRAYAADGTPEGGEMLVNTYTTGDQLDAEVTALDGGGWVVTWTSNGQDGSQTGVYQKVFHLNDGPMGAIVDQTATEDAPFSFTIPVDAFTDPDGDTLTYAATLAGGGQLPVWLSFNAATRTFSGTPDEADTGQIDVNVTVSDGINPEVSDTFTLTVGSVNDAPEGTDTTIRIEEDKSHTFAVADFGFTDDEGSAFAAVVIATLPGNGTLKLDGVNVTAGQSITLDDLDGLVWEPVRNAHGDGLATFTFQVVDDGTDTDPSANTITFDVTGVADRIIGGNGGTTLKGTSDDDILRGRRGDDILLGRGGDDSLRSVGGNDKLVGGAGSDTFLFSTQSHRDTIADFETGIDHIDLSKWKAIKDFGDVKSHAANHGDDVWITAGHDTLVIRDTHKGELAATDFIF